MEDIYIHLCEFNKLRQLSSCPDGYYSDQLFTYCQQCDQSCFSCHISSTFCTGCHEGYYLENSSCFQCQASCKTCNQQFTCSSCFDRFYLDPIYQICLACINNCQKCSTNSQNCLSCYDGFYLDNTLSIPTCLACQNNCKTCNNSPATCTSCFDGYFLDQNNQCQPCDPICLSCSNSSSNCSLCVEGYFVQNNSCQQCDTTCKTCLQISTICQSCFNNYIYDDNLSSCTLCPEICQTCDSSTKQCTSCFDGYSLVNGQCQQCNLPCKTCQSGDVNFCLSCFSNYYIDSSNCKICSDYCMECTDFQTCSKCQDGYFRDINNLCIVCDKKCKSCNNSSNQCTSCFDGYYLDTINKTCNSCQQGCKQCINSTTCNIGQCYDQYYYDNSPQNCKPCSSNCLACTSNNNCTACEQGFRISSGQCSQCSSNCIQCNQSDCLKCKDGYYQDFLGQCSACSSNCLTCSNSYKKCTACYFYYYLQGTSCQQSYTCPSCNTSYKTCINQTECGCIQGYFYQSNSCSQCIANCQICLNSTTCETCNQPYKLTSSKQCIKIDCYSNQYFDGSQCQFCPPGCLTCDSGLICTQCVTGYQLQINANGKECLICKYPSTQVSGSNVCNSCVAKFNLNNGTCQPMNQPCKIRNDITSICESCPDKFYLDNADNSCKPCKIICSACSNLNTCTQCIPGYYKDSYNQCQPCNYNCLTCSDSSTCTQCFDEGISRDSAPQCLCKDGYFQIGNLSMCSQCDTTCLKCLYQSNNCIECDAAQFRILIPGGQCVCIQGYYEIFYPQRQCLACDSNCLDCFGPGPQKCLSCKAGFYLNPLYSSCQCNQGQFLNTSGICEDCRVGCISCLSLSECIQCAPNMELSQDKTTCSCLKGYFQNQAVCEQCDVAFCEDCSVNKSQCLKCFTGILQYTPIDKCECSNSQSNSFISNLKSCSLCHYSCATCDGFEANNCISCPSNRQFNQLTSTCNCKEGTYEDQASQSCKNCHYSCLKCIGSFQSDCIQCPLDTTTFRIISPDRKPQDISFNCICSPGYFDKPQQQLCEQCSYQCETCIGFATNCLSCKTNLFRILSSINTCICGSGYYDDGSNNQCQKCHYSCTKCVNGTRSGCVECPANTFRYSQYATLTPYNSFECLCIERYYDDGVNSICKKCHYSCQYCIGPNSTDCISCDKALVFQRSFVPNSLSPISTTGVCKCIGGYFDDQANILCSKCPYYCKTCDDQQQCLTCDVTRDLVGKVCQCKKGYLEIGNQACDACSSLCSECSLTKYKCTACDTANNFRQLNQQNSCLCLEKFYDSSEYDKNTRIPILEVPKCLKCRDKCKSCGVENPDICLSCFTNQNYILNPEKLCVCMFGFEEKGTICEETFLVSNSFIDENKLESLKNIIQTLLKVIKILSLVHLIMNQPFQSLLGFRINLTLIFLNYSSVRVSKIIQTVTELQEVEDPFSVFNFMRFLSPSQEDINKRELFNKRIFLSNKPLSFIDNAQGYFFLFILTLSIYLVLKLTILKRSVLISSKIYRKQKWRYQMYKIDQNIIFPLFITFLQVLMIKMFFFGMVDIITTQSYSFTGSILSLIVLIIYGISYILCIKFLYASNDNDIIKNFFENDLKPNNANFFFLQLSIDILICAYFTVQSTDFKQQTIIITLGYMALGFFALIQKPFKLYFENYLEFFYYAGLTATLILFQQAGQLTLVQLMNDEQQIDFNKYSFYFVYSLVVALVIGIICIAIKLAKGIYRIILFIKTLREFNSSETALWEVEVVETQKIIIEHQKQLLITDQQQINKNILKEIMNSEIHRKETHSTQHLQTITLTPRNGIKQLQL